MRKKRLQDIAHKIKLTERQSAKLVGIPETDYINLSPSSSLSTGTDAVIKLEELYEIGLTTFDGNRSGFEAWLQTPIPVLNGNIPNQIIDSLEGIAVVKNLLLQMEYGVI